MKEKRKETERKESLFGWIVVFLLNDKFP